MTRACVGLGSNLENPARQVRTALEKLRATPGIEIVAISGFYRSAPLGPAGQDDYCNAVCSISTSLSAQELLRKLQAIETAMARARGGPRWGPRVIDLDLLLYGDAIIATPELTVPHPEMHRRNFVLAPLAEIAPDVVIPGHGMAADLAERIGREGLAPWTD